MSACGDSSGDAVPASRLDHYGDASFMDEQMRVIDLVPRRLTTIWLWLVGGLAIISGLEILHNWQRDFSAGCATGQFAAFDLTRSGSLGSWFSSLLLLGSCVAAALVYAVRRHRIDDYRGRYRIWLWAVLCCFMAGADVSTGLHESFKQLMIHLTKTPVCGDGSVWWVVPCLLVLGFLAWRVALDMRPCRLAVSALLLAGACYLFVASMELGLPLMGDADRAMVKAGIAMYGHLMLLASMALTARHVILDAEGLLPRGASKTRKRGGKRAKKSPATETDKQTRVDAPQGVPQPASDAWSPATNNSVAAQPVFSSSPPPPAAVTRKLTKQEKKALRDRLLREQLERQRRM